ncbi:MAG: hypothetical protein ACUVRR_07310, partial [Candidatus Fervidibacter sp.]
LAIGWEMKKPKKKPKGRKLTEEEKNRRMNRGREKVEHKIMAMKRYQVFGGLYRGRGSGEGRDGRRVGEHGGEGKEREGVEGVKDGSS